MFDYLKEKNIWLIGAGYMAAEYAKVLQEMNIPFKVIGRGMKSAMNFEKKTGFAVQAGEVNNFLKQTKELLSAAIVAVSVEQLAAVTQLLLKKGVKHILVEKPAGLNLEELEELNHEAKIQKANVFVAYNRRFYASTLKAKEIINEDSGVTSFNFDFTEWSHIIKDKKLPDIVKKQWFLASSTHVVNLAFFLGGMPKEIKCYTTGGLSWHPSASIFCGAGATEQGLLFSYHSNWEAPGRWGVEIFTRKYRLILRPLEDLYIQKIGSLISEKVIFDDSLDHKFKPGLYKQVESFLNNPVNSCLCRLNDHYLMAKNFYVKISGQK
jgi:predicted dehydrogenase